MPQSCPHCGIALLAVVDAYCPECREELPAAPQAEAPESGPVAEAAAAWRGVSTAVFVASLVIGVIVALVDALPGGVVSGGAVAVLLATAALGVGALLRVRRRATVTVTGRGKTTGRSEPPEGSPVGEV